MFEIRATRMHNSTITFTSVEFSSFSSLMLAQNSHRAKSILTLTKLFIYICKHMCQTSDQMNQFTFNYFMKKLIILLIFIFSSMKTGSSLLLLTLCLLLLACNSLSQFINSTCKNRVLYCYHHYHCI